MERVAQEIIIHNPQGLHARPAAIFVQIANKFDSSVKLEKDGEAVDGKSIIAVLSLGASKGTKVVLIVEGEDSTDALNELRGFLEREDEV